MYLVSEQ